MMSKGSRARPKSVSNDEYAQRWDMIFGTDNVQSCGCGRSASGICNGSHSLTEEEYEQKLFAVENTDK